jgi:glucokinase
MEHPQRRAPKTATLRGYNLERLLSAAMSRPGPFTRGELIVATGLSAPAVGYLTSQLIARGLARDLGPGPSRGGRRPTLMEFNARYGFVAGIDVGPTRTRLAIADLRGDRLAHRIIQTPLDPDPVAALGGLADAVRALMEEAAVPPGGLMAVGAGAPGVVDLDRGMVVLAPNLEGWRSVPMRDVLERALGAPTLVENDVNLALIGEHWQGAARGHETCAFVFVGTGIGAAVLIDGALLRGHHFMAGEIAVMCMGREYLDVDFGPHGCLETLAGLQALARRCPAGTADRDDWLPRLLEAAERGEACARQAVDDAVNLLGIAAANVGAVVDPSVIVLGGALFANAQPLVSRVRTIVQRLTRARVEVVRGGLGKEAPLAGCLLLAATHAREHLLQELRAGLGPEPATPEEHHA